MDKTYDLELEVMRLVSADELDRFTEVLETIEKEQAWFEKFKSKTDPNLRLGAMPVKEREDLMAHRNRWEGALNKKTEIIGKYADQGPAWNQGKLNREVTDRTEFWRLVYHRILYDRGAEIGKDPRFRNVKILEVLKDWVADCLPGFAERFREKGNPILAQVLETLAERGK